MNNTFLNKNYQSINERRHWNKAGFDIKFNNTTDNKVGAYFSYTKNEKL